MRDDREKLLDILEAIQNIQRRAGTARDKFLQDELLQVWAIHHIQIIGEAAANLSAEFRERYPTIPWSDIVSMRNILVHQYFGVDLNQVWDTVVIDLPQLKSDIEAIVKEMEERP